MKPNTPILSGLLVLMVLTVAPFVWAGPITGGPGNPPFTKLGVYQGVLSIIPGSAGNSVMEIGNAGRDIASTGSVILRPGGSATASGASTYAEFFNEGNQTNLRVPGRICKGATAATCFDIGGGSQNLDSVLATGPNPGIGTAKTISLYNQAPAVKSLEVSSGATTGSGNFAFLAPSLGNGSYNNLSQGNDAGLFYGDGKGFVIAPWENSVAKGLRIAADGKTWVTGLCFTGDSSCQSTSTPTLDMVLRVVNGNTSNQNIILNNQVPNKASLITTAGATPLFGSGSYASLVPLLANGGFNPLTNLNDSGLIFSDATGLVVAPWSNSTKGARFSGSSVSNAALAVNNNLAGTGGAHDTIAAYANYADGSAIYAQQNGSGWAGYFSGNINVTNQLCLNGSCINSWPSSGAPQDLNNVLGVGNTSLLSASLGTSVTPTAKLLVHNNQSGNITAVPGTGRAGDAIAAYANSSNSAIFASQEGSSATSYAGYFNAPNTSGNAIYAAATGISGRAIFAWGGTGASGYAIYAQAGTSGLAGYFTGGSSIFDGSIIRRKSGLDYTVPSYIEFTGTPSPPLNCRGACDATSGLNNSTQCITAWSYDSSGNYATQSCNTSISVSSRWGCLCK